MFMSREMQPSSSDARCWAERDVPKERILSRVTDTFRAHVDAQHFGRAFGDLVIPDEAFDQRIEEASSLDRFNSWILAARKAADGLFLTGDDIPLKDTYHRPRHDVESCMWGKSGG